ncbi:hypothetical protein SMF913_27751 [Streptomyces malaysiensis]|uniref:Uncharacterized protein n=1 Tax=Streptomyces malaysiensis TaxID=92644 RepID=A0A2J7YW97_STRMQ|nr:hypothetical protein SMF913_27751 [Streptomyces malaysiensis]
MPRIVIEPGMPRRRIWMPSVLAVKRAPGMPRTSPCSSKQGTRLRISSLAMDSEARDWVTSFSKVRVRLSGRGSADRMPHGLRVSIIGQAWPDRM